MALEYEPFTRIKLDEDKAKEKSRVITIRFNKEDDALLEQVRKVIEQDKEGTAIKSMFYLGAYDVIHNEKTRHLIGTLFKNKRTNQRTGVVI